MAGKFRKTIDKLSVVIKKVDQAKANAADESQTEAAPKNAASEASDKTQSPNLSDPSSYELLLDDREPKTQKEEERLNKEKTLLSMELRHQKGISLTDDYIHVPGRVPLMPVTLLEVFCTVVGFSTGLIHFSVLSPNYLFALIVISLLLLSQIVIYHSAYRTMRLTITIIQTIGTIVLMALVGWAFYDLIAYNPKHQHHLLLGVSLVFFELVPALMFLHLVFFGRSYRKLKIAVKPAPDTSDEPKPAKQRVSFLPQRSRNALKPVVKDDAQNKANTQPADASNIRQQNSDSSDAG
ncbi:MAG: hypothetical protein IKY83_13625 [Proteobacteria bacterium]|nr:hypothetical protein [Pseudomonadota bacterium]